MNQEIWELNLRLAEWLGWGEDDFMIDETGMMWPPNNHLWPVFTESMDACLEFLIPALRNMGVEITINSFPAIEDTEEWEVWLDSIGMVCDSPAKAETAPLSLCIAVDDLIRRSNDKRSRIKGARVNPPTRGRFVPGHDCNRESC